MPVASGATALNARPLTSVLRKVAAMRVIIR